MKAFIKKKSQTGGGGQTLEIAIQKIVPGGFGLAFAEGLTVFVPLVAAGDKILAKINRKKGNVAFAEAIEIIEAAPARVQPGCPYFGACGGCDFQQMSYPAQLAAKAGIVRDCLERIGKINYAGEIEIIGSPRDYRYRSRAQWHADTRRRKIGYFRRGSHDVIDVAECPILVPELEKTLADFRADLNWEEFWAETVEIETASASAISVYSAELVEPTKEIFFEAAGERYFYNAESFFQGNLFLVEPLIKAATENAAGGGGDDKTALDLYCGVGLFALPLARKFGRVFGVEGNPKAIDFARRNAEHARLANVEFFDESVADWLAENAVAKPDFVLLDPPRAGAERETIEALLKIKPAEISYVSCDPATLARDLRMLTETYAIEKITALDLFPQTHHVETVVRLKLG